MKITLTCPAFLPATQFGGIMFLCLDIAKQLSKKNDVTIYTTDLDFANNTKTFNKRLPRHERINGYEINRSHVILKVKLFFVNPGMYKQIKIDKPDIIHAIGIRAFQTFIAAMVSKFNNVPLIVSDQGGLFTHPDFGKGFVNKLLYRIQEPMIKFIINQSKKIVVANEYECSIFQRYVQSEKLVIVNNGIDLNSFKDAKEDFRKVYGIKGRIILFVGRFNHVKGIDILIKAYSNICKKSEFDDVTLVIMGADFGYGKKMHEIIRKLNLNERILIIERPTRETVLSAYHGCDFLVLPSRWEMSPLTPLEGFAFKKPTISTNVHGIPYVVKDGINGILIEPENFDRLSKAIIDLLRDDKKRVELGNNGFKMVEDKFNSEIMVGKLFEIYKDVINVQ